MILFIALMVAFIYLYVREAHLRQSTAKFTRRYSRVIAESKRAILYPIMGEHCRVQRPLDLFPCPFERLITPWRWSIYQYVHPSTLVDLEMAEEEWIARQVSKAV